MKAMEFGACGLGGPFACCATQLGRDAMSHDTTIAQRQALQFAKLQQQEAQKAKQTSQIPPGAEQAAAHLQQLQSDQLLAKDTVQEALGFNREQFKEAIQAADINAADGIDVAELAKLEAQVNPAPAHPVESGDTLTAIANGQGFPTKGALSDPVIKAYAQANGLDNPNSIAIGTPIYPPGSLLTTQALELAGQAPPEGVAPVDHQMAQLTAIYQAKNAIQREVEAGHMSQQDAARLQAALKDAEGKVNPPKPAPPAEPTGGAAEEEVHDSRPPHPEEVHDSHHTNQVPPEEVHDSHTPSTTTTSCVPQPAEAPAPRHSSGAHDGVSDALARFEVSGKVDDLQDAIRELPHDDVNGEVNQDLLAIADRFATMEGPEAKANAEAIQALAGMDPRDGGFQEAALNALQDTDCTSEDMQALADHMSEPPTDAELSVATTIAKAAACREGEEQGKIEAYAAAFEAMKGTSPDMRERLQDAIKDQNNPLGDYEGIIDHASSEGDWKAVAAYLKVIEARNPAEGRQYPATEILANQEAVELLAEGPMAKGFAQMPPEVQTQIRHALRDQDGTHGDLDEGFDKLTRAGASSRYPEAFATLQAIAQAVGHEELASRIKDGGYLG